MVEASHPFIDGSCRVIVHFPVYPNTGKGEKVSIFSFYIFSNAAMMHVTRALNALKFRMEILLRGLDIVLIRYR